MADPPHEIPLTQNHPSKCLIRMVIWSLPHFLHPFLSFFPYFSTYVTGDIPNNVDVPPVAAQVLCEDGFCGSKKERVVPPEKGSINDSYL